MLKNSYLLMTVAPFALITTAHASEAEPTPAAKKADSDMVTTGVARGRDRLDSATSTSSIKESEIQKFGAHSLGEIFRNIPGVRSENLGSEGYSNISIRGLPIALGGAKFLQIQEDGMPTLEFGDIAFFNADNFLRFDLNVSQIEAIRGGSASTFASNSPGGVINLLSKTGDVEGGAIQGTVGLDYEEYRTDFEYGAKLSDSLRFHIGGFYRQGEGPRKVGYDAFKGGQVKFNITKDFSGGYIRFYGKVLDDKTPLYSYVPARVGTGMNPDFSSLPGLDIKDDTTLSPSFNNVTLDRNGNITRTNVSEGIHSKVYSAGIETQFSLGEWSVTERFRYSDVSGGVMGNYILFTGAADTIAATLKQLAGQSVLSTSTYSYATGPNKGQVITNPSALNGNGVLAASFVWDQKLRSLNNITNDLRISRVWDAGEGKLTTTAGFYKSRQTIKMDGQWNVAVTDARGDGQMQLINIVAGGTTPLTNDGYYTYGTPAAIGAPGHNLYDLNYDVNAPYASANYQIGKLAIGASVRYDFGYAKGQLVGTETGGFTSVPRDMNGDGVITGPENAVQTFPTSSPRLVDYGYNYFSYSGSINYRVAEPFSLFARYSKGGRANADRILFGSGANMGAIHPTSGKLRDPAYAVDYVKQAEIGAKFRKDGLTLNATGFWAKTTEHNIGLNREYKAVGVEFEGGYRTGVFAIYGSATYTDAEITKDLVDATVVGNRPKHSASVIFQATPQIETDLFTVGANFIGTTDSYALDTNQFKMPGYVVTNAFLQVRPVERITLSLNANNLFNVLGLVEAGDRTAGSTVGTVRAINGRTLFTSVRFNF